jgi:aminoglycoside phosphotransferase (APT) family kinase protein
MTSDLKRNLEAYVAQNYPNRQNTSISRLENISDGWESEMYSFNLSYGPQNSRTVDRLALRIYPGDNAIEKSQRESEAMRILFDSGYPVPKIFALDTSLSYIERPFVLMQWIEGQVMWSMFDRVPAAQRADLISLFCSLFVRLHNLDWRPFTEKDFDQNGPDIYRYVDRWFVEARAALDRYSVIDLKPIVDWLEPKRDLLACQNPSPVHQDFHPANILVQSDGQAAVIDWTGFDVSDLRFDLAWTLVLVNAYSGQELRDEILEGYEKLIGERVSEIETFEVFACTRRLFDVFVSLSEGPQRLGMRPEAIETIRKQMYAVENVYQLLVNHTGIRVADVEELIRRER